MGQARREISEIDGHVGRRLVKNQQVEAAEQVAVQDGLVGGDGHKAAGLLPRLVGGVGQKVDRGRAVVVGGLPHPAADVHTRRRGAHIGDLVGRDPAQKPLEQAVLVAHILVHHVDRARALAAGVGVQVGQAQHVARLVDEGLLERQRLLARAGARGLALKGVHQDARAYLLAVKGPLHVLRGLGVGGLLGPPGAVPIPARASELQVDGIDVAVVVGVALREVHLVVNLGQDLIEENAEVILIVGARVGGRAAHDLGGLEIQLAVAGSLIVGVEALVGVGGVGHVALCVEGAEKVLVRLRGIDDLRGLGAVLACGEAHADHDGAGLAAGGKAQHAALREERRGGIGGRAAVARARLGQRLDARGLLQPLLRLGDKRRRDALVPRAR